MSLTTHRTTVCAAIKAAMDGNPGEHAACTLTGSKLTKRTNAAAINIEVHSGDSMDVPDVQMKPSSTDSDPPGDDATLLDDEQIRLA